ncbi:MAG TPA: glycosyltransferase family 4 protein [Firmicutes bacterium]|nr:glycosyltransferase family 4 protein [Candidatus Fermentithermobacillaceae bacterium]
MSPQSAITVIVALPLSWALTKLVQHYALKRGILDIPNERSSHTVPTPRGGGLAIVITFFASVFAMAFLRVVPSRLVLAILGGGLLVSGIGWLDDRRSLSPLVRAAVHLLASAWTVYWLGGLPSLNLGFCRISIPFFGTCLAMVGMVWSINLYNFMDGIDGLAGSEAVSVGIVGGALAALCGALDVALLSWVLAAACAGFLMWNWPPAKIFMGDVGSGFLGFIFATLALATENAAAVPLFAWVLLLGVFVVDATATLVRRVVRGERWYEAHRSHAYQLAVRAGYTHKQVVLAVLAINAVLSVLGIAVLLWREYTIPIFAMGLASLLMLHSAVLRRLENADIPKPSLRS